jgi:hypothetical protein
LQDDLDFGHFNFNTGYAIGGGIPSTTGGEEMVFQGWIPANSADYKLTRTSRPFMVLNSLTSKPPSLTLV